MQQYDMMQSGKSSASSFSMYMRELQNIPQMTVQEQRIIGEKLKHHNTKQQAKQQLITSNLRLVVKIAHDYMGIGLGIDDLVQQGNLGLIRAAETFSVDKGVKFSTYSANWIKNYISRAINKKGRMIRVPIATEQKRRKLKKYIEANEALGITVTNEMIKKEFGLSDLQLKNGLRKTDFVVSMNQKVDNSDSNSEQIGSLICDNLSTSTVDDIIKEQDNRILHNFVNKLPHREQTIIKLRFGLQDGHIYTLKEVADRIGKTYQRVRQLEKDALIMLRKMFKNNLKN